MKRTIALLTDFGLKDSYVGVMKGVILNINSDVDLVDITHNINAQDVSQAATVLKNAYKYFPSKTIFLCVVDPGVGSKREPIIVKTKNYIFVGPDNGLLTPIIEEEKGQVFMISDEKYFLRPVSQTFHGRDIFAPVAAHLSKGTPVTKIGKCQDKHCSLILPKPRVDKKRQCIIGQIVNIDKFGNLITNVPSSLADEDVVIHLKKKVINKLNHSYSDSKEGELLAVIGSDGFLEISVNSGSAAEILKSKIGDTFKIDQKKSKVQRKQTAKEAVKPIKKGPIKPFDVFDDD